MTLFKHIILVLLLLIGVSCTMKEQVLRVIQAPSSQITGNQYAGYQIQLEEMHDTVIWFSDRPTRKAGSIHIKGLFKTEILPLFHSFSSGRHFSQIPYYK